MKHEITFVSLNELVKTLSTFESGRFFGDTTIRWKDGKVVDIIEIRETKKIGNAQDKYK